jgi:anti-sigma B factor antagonist
MPFAERRIQDIAILDFEGRLTFTAGAELGRRISALAASDTTKVVINLERVSYVDSAGLGALVHAFTELSQRHGMLKFVNGSARTQHVLKITGIATLVETFASEKSALASFAGPVIAGAGPGARSRS